ncbi:uncharacterized protein Z518_08440 [Rhinocladiella mackenziei CBS 650.93]|uniref:Nucleoside phosphorylase domain-containing protein n=1 Tax=Rhinocladiella mackenziei CBS 650.93 TaxID=1442369 RepID=A0A0D2I9K5_9EURO|nr:uncharacterized protein Z518_08440 [Rhinocladiella mackenziei CBS 650.93]KIX02499.1 hypothetical protein Z518_08440 [Rhinocladiella mackenziei CBS 650.93]
MPPRPYEDYRIGWICALSIEMVAARAMLDEEHGLIRGQGQDTNTYYGGRIHDHNVIIACLPAGVSSLVSATHVGKDMIRTFRELRFVLLVGIGGGIPDLPTHDIRLGDVVVSRPGESHGGVTQLDKGKAIHGGIFRRQGSLNAPPNTLLTAISALDVEHRLNDGSTNISNYLSDILRRGPHMRSYGYPGVEKDRLFHADYPHPPENPTCSKCNSAHEIHRKLRYNTIPQIHYGVIASGNLVVKNPVYREELRRDASALCVETEAAGLMNILPCLVVRGICNYADSHKNDIWHPYAAATAAAFTKELLLYVSTDQTDHEEPISESLGHIQQYIEYQEPFQCQEAMEQTRDNSRMLQANQIYNLDAYEEQRNHSRTTSAGLLEDAKY